jgi:hypothetical protein
VEVVAPEETVGLQLWVAKADAFHHLGGQHDLGVEFAEAAAAVPAQRLFFYRDAAEADGGAPELLLDGEGVLRFVGVGNVGGPDERALDRTTDVAGFSKAGAEEGVAKALLPGFRHVPRSCVFWVHCSSAGNGCQGGGPSLRSG